MPWFQIEKLPTTKRFDHCRSDAVIHAHPTDVATMGGGLSKDQVTISAATGDKATSETTNGTVSTDMSPYMTRSHLLRLSWAVNHYAMSQYLVAPRDWSLLSLSFSLSFSASPSPPPLPVCLSPSPPSTSHPPHPHPSPYLSISSTQPLPPPLPSPHDHL